MKTVILDGLEYVMPEDFCWHTLGVDGPQILEADERFFVLIYPEWRYSPINLVYSPAAPAFDTLEQAIFYADCIA